MEHNRRARPTVRLLAEDLHANWEDPHYTRAIADGRWDTIQPLGELPHPLLRKAAAMYGPDPRQDPAPRLIGCSGDLRLQELRNAQWRAGIWTDPATGVRWVVTAGLAKGDHQDDDDFYKLLGRQVARPDRGSSLLPTSQDFTLLKRETAAWALTRWHLDIQNRIAAALRGIRSTRTVVVELPQTPSRQPSRIGRVEIEFDDIPDAGTPREEFTLTFELEPAHEASRWGWLAMERVLICVAPPVQDWDRYRNHAWVICEVGHLDRQGWCIDAADSRSELLSAEQGAVGHYTHSAHIAEASVNGTAIRAMCGVVFVPMRDPDQLPVCPRCAEQFATLPS
ncbi:DUF3039 domain-containing protein [Nocardia grenadensis]|uniref:DUF3039 domain-containing protein n=1 Tax=Nocardia grenadensis TaxID=931537 RepID=UPI0007A50782|nr:DUF3039 domain-containing protein [Nocardia grenadensis]